VLNAQAAAELDAVLRAGRRKDPARDTDVRTAAEQGAPAVRQAGEAADAMGHPSAAAANDGMPESEVRPPVPQIRFALEYLVLRMADELDLPARRVRVPLLHLLRDMQTSNLTLNGAAHELVRWIEQAQSGASSR
jgi:hypothetical protein